MSLELVEINRLLEQWSHEMTSDPSENFGPGRDDGGDGINGLRSGGMPNIDLASLPHNNDATWYLPGIDRSTAEKHLVGKPNGTFLVRRSQDGRHALSISCNGTVEHCRIEETERGIGFAEPYNIYPNLKELVLHYSQYSLEEYNDKLTTKLAFPIQGTIGFHDY